MSFQIIVLAGGYGTRIRSTIGDNPKILAPVNNKPFIDWLIIWINSWKISYDKKIVLSTCVGHKKIESYCKSKGYKIDCISETKPLGTFGAIANVSSKIFSEDYIIINGDTIFKTDLKSISKEYKKNKKPLILLKKNNQENFGGYVKKNNGWVYSPSNTEYISTGFFFISYQEIKSRWIKTTNINFKNELINKQYKNKYMIDKDCFGTNPISAKIFENELPFIDIGIPSEFKKAQTYVPKILENK